MILARSFDKEMHDRKSTVVAKLLKSTPWTRNWYYGRMKTAHLGTNIPPLLEHIDREARDAALLSPFKLGRSFERFLGASLSLAAVEERAMILREIVLQLRAVGQEYGANTLFGHYTFPVESRLAEQLERISGELPVYSIQAHHAKVLFTSIMKPWPWMSGPAMASAHDIACSCETLAYTCTDLKLELSDTKPQVGLSGWDKLLKVERAR